MYEQIRKKAKKKVEAKVAFYTTSIVFFFTSIILIMLSFYLPEIGFWLLLPLPAFLMVLGVLYVTAFGLPFAQTYSKDWQEEEIEKEMLRLYHKAKEDLPPIEDLSELEILELKRLQRIERKWDSDQNFV